ncbi:MAG: HU family DNA-binding protein [Spirochaetia bacterium]|nr:HU family DNA-binding protein [Spirochaetia bacterium]
MNKADLIDRVWASLPFRLEKARVEILVENVFAEITASLGKGDEAKIRDFGSFVTRRRKSRRTRLPGSKEIHHSPERTAVSFIPSPHLLNGLPSKNS